jgi:hypothetical protein
MQATCSDASAQPKTALTANGPLTSLERLSQRIRSLGMEPAHAMSVLLIALALIGWGAIVSGTLHAGAIAFALLYPLTAYYLGRLVLAAVNVEVCVKTSFAVLFLLGYLALGLIQLAVHSLLPGLLGWQFGVIFATVLLGQLLLVPRDQNPAAPDAWGSVYLCGFCLLAATCWARGLLRPVQFDGREVVFRHWWDFFIHASLIARFTTELGLWRMGNGEIAGLPPVFYHYASYLGPVTQTLFSGQSALEAARGYWTPMGTFLTGLAAYVLVLPWAGRGGGVCAAVALLVVPDASHYWPANCWLAYHWLQQIGCAGMYGTACAALSLTMLGQWRRQHARSALVLGLSLMAATLLYKAQIFVVFVPLFGACLGLYWPGLSRRRRRLLFVAWGVVCFLGALLLNRLHPQDRPFGLNYPFFEDYGRLLAVNFPEGRCRRLLEAGFAGLGRSRYYAAVLGLSALSAFGLWLALAALLLLRTLFRRQFAVTDTPPWLALMVYLIFLAGLNDYALVGHTKWEITHRPFVWVYFLLCTWCAGRTWCLLKERRVVGGGRNNRLLAVAALVLPSLMLVLPWRMGLRVQEGTFPWQFEAANVRAASGLVESAHFLAAAGQRTDIIQDSHCDAQLILGGLSEKRSYLARLNDWQRHHSARVRQEVEKRRLYVERLPCLTSLAELVEAARESGIRWFVLHPDDDVAWPKAILDKPAFAWGGYRVFDLAALPSAAGYPTDKIAITPSSSPVAPLKRSER